MSLENEINCLNEYFFFKEFTYSKNIFKRSDSQEVEIADSIVYLDEVSFVFQLKERNDSFHSTPEKERNWFKKKVLRLATKQIRDTVSYIRDYQHVILSNNRGDIVDVSLNKLKNPHKLVVYKSSDLLPEDCENKKFHISGAVGVIHILPARDYVDVVECLLTPSEVFEYFSFREDLIKRYNSDINSIPEPLLLGQYLSGEVDQAPSFHFIEYLYKLDRGVDSWDMTGFMKIFRDRIISEETSKDYYFIMKEIAKLMRDELTAFKERFMYSWEAALNNASVLPYRFMVQRTGCSFLFVPLLMENESRRRDALINLTYLNKYSLNAPKAIGVSFIASEGEWVNVEWCCIDSPWEVDEELDELLKSNFPFRDVKNIRLDRYKFE